MCRHFDLLFLGSQKFTFLRGYLNRGRGEGADIKWSGPIIGGLEVPNFQQKASNQFAFLFLNIIWCFHKVIEPFISN